jgi:hypothetical protein
LPPVKDVKDEQNFDVVEEELFKKFAKQPPAPENRLSRRSAAAPAPADSAKRKARKKPMRKASLIEKDRNEITTVEDLTGVFESIASTQVAKIKDKTQMAEEFFELLWKRYSAIRLTDKLARNAPTMKKRQKSICYYFCRRRLVGDIDQRLIEAMLKDYDASNTDIVVLGTHGANQLHDRGIPYIKFFKIPESDTYIDVTPIVDAFKRLFKNKCLL